MRLNQLKFFVILVLGSAGLKLASAQSPVDQLQPLVETSAHRLAIARQVAFAKWDSGAAVEDSAREAHVIENAVKLGESKSLDQAWLTNVFKAQIEANKIVQYSLLADWRRAGSAPAHKPISLVNEIRPELDQVQTALISDLAGVAALRSTTTCRTDVAKAVGKYVAAKHLQALDAIALDRAMAATCTGY